MVMPLVALTGQEITGVAALAGLVVTSSFGLSAYILKLARDERSDERRVREKEAEATKAAIEALRERRGA